MALNGVQATAKWGPLACLCASLFQPFLNHQQRPLPRFGRFRLTLQVVVGPRLATVGDIGREFACNSNGNFPCRRDSNWIAGCS